MCIKGLVYYLLGHRAESPKLNLAALHIKEILEDPSPPWLPLVAPSDGQLKHPAESCCTFFCWESGTGSQAKPTVLAAILHSVTMSMVHGHDNTREWQRYNQGRKMSWEPSAGITDGAAHQNINVNWISDIWSSCSIFWWHVIIITSQIWSLSLGAYFDYSNWFQTVGCEEKKGAINTAHITAVLQLIDTLIRENESARPIVQIQVQIFSKRSNRLLHQRGHIKTGLHVMFFLGLHQLCCSLPYSIINLYMWFIIIVYGEATMINMYVPHTKTCVRKTTSMPECCPEHNFQHCWHTVHFYHPWQVQLSVVRLYL